jgi:hypothetical protein
MMAADGASSSITLMKSCISCGAAMSFPFPRKTGRQTDSPACLPDASLSDAAGAVGNPKLQQSRDTRDQQEPDCREHPFAEPAPHGKRSDCHQRGSAGSHWGDHVANPIDEVQERTFRLCSCLPLDSHIDLGSGPQVLGYKRCLSYENQERDYYGDSQLLPPCGLIRHWDWVFTPFRPALLLGLARNIAGN